VNKKRRALAVLLLAAALALAALGQFYFLRRREYLWDGLVFQVLAVLCFVLAWRQASVHRRPPRTRRRWSLQLDAWIRQRPLPAALVALGLFLSALATLLSRNRLWDQPGGAMAVLWLLGIGLVGMAALWPTGLRWDPLARFLGSPAPSLAPPSTPALESPQGPRPKGVGSAPGRPDGAGSSAPGSSAPAPTIGTPGSGLASSPTSGSSIPALEAATIAGLTLLALMLRVTALSTIPYTLGGDEAWHGLLARQVLSGELRNPFVMGYMSMPTLFYWPLSWSLRLVGDNVVGLRLPAALVGAATVPVLYLFARRLWGRRVAFLAAAFLAAYDYHIHYSRLGANNVWDALFVLLTLWALHRGLNASDGVKQTHAFVLTGLVMGLSVYFYTGARLLPVLVAVYLAFFWVQQRLRQPRLESVGGLEGRSLLLMAVAFLVAAGPMLGFALARPADWNARVNQVGILQSGWLAREPGLTGKSTFQILAEQFLRAAGAFHVFPDRTVWYGAERPLLDFLAGIFALLGMVWTVVHWRDRRYFLVAIWFWSVIVAGGMLTESPPSSQRLTMAIPAVVLLVAIGLEQTVRLARRVLAFHRRWADLALGLLVLVLAVSNVHYYFADFTPSRRYGGANGETATMIGAYLQGLNGGTHAYFFGAPRIYWSFGTMTFLAPDVVGQDVVEPLSAPPDFVEEGQPAVFVFLPERAAELAWVQQAFPDGRLREFRDSGGQLRFIAYEAP
jgi:4-amino-4-deoxy-L-arabinose transferase-like glycosyltransferase